MRNFLCAVAAVILVFTASGCKVRTQEKTPEAKQTVIKSAGTAERPPVKNTAVQESETGFLETLNLSLSRVAEAVKPSVVNISTTKTVSFRQHPFEDLFDDPFFRRFFGDRPHPFGNKRKYKQSSLGSGVIVTHDGYILTNNHVVQDVDEIKVILNDQREFSGRVIGTDSKSDLAIIKVEAEDLPAIGLGESDNLRVGELVIAIGNPFGLGHTITMGIVSAVGRSNVGIAEYEDFIQTDAAINPGNSGGALVNVRGELVGINTAIFSTSGGYMGIGFAIPSDMANSIMQSIIKHGKVVRGWLGVTIQDVTADLSKHFNIKEEKGVLITDVVEDSPAEKAGLKRGDVIVGFNNRPVEDVSDLRNMVAAVLPGNTADVKVIRDEKEIVITATVGEMPDTVADAKSAYDNAMAGVHVQDITAEIKRGLNIPESAGGVLVTMIEDDSPAIDRLRQNDLIQEINKKRISNTKEYEEVVSGIGEKESLLLLVFRNGGYIYVSINP